MEKKNGKKILVFPVLLCVICFGISVQNVYATPALRSEIEYQVDTLFNRYYDSLEKGQLQEVSDLFFDTKEADLFQDFMYWRAYTQKVLDLKYSDYEFDWNVISYNESEDVVYLQIMLDADYHIDGVAETLQDRDIAYVLEFSQDNGIYKIKSITTDDDDYILFKQRMAANQNEYSTKALSVSDMDASLNKILNETAVIASEINSMPVEECEDFESDISLLSTSVSYSSSRGRMYANKYGVNNAPFFYKAGADCTNFVSQCVWAAYGGWRYDQSQSTIENDIKNKRRMTGDWYAGSGGGSSKWESVNSFWSYVTGNTGNGPKATGYNNGKKYTGVTAGSINVGNVLQFRSGTSGNYTHSVYVYDVPTQPKYSTITVMQHSSNKKRVLSEVISAYGSNCCMRQMVFKTATFSN